MHLPDRLRSFLAEPRVANPPGRDQRDVLRRDVVLVVLVCVTAVLEATLRTDEGWTGVAPGWRWGAAIVFFASVPPALWVRRTRPLLALVWSFVPTLAYGAAVAALAGNFGGIMTVSIALVTVYSLFRWGSGREGAIGAAVVVGVGVVGNLAEPEQQVGNWIGGFVVLSLPVLIGLTVRYQDANRERLLIEVRSRERAELARELHDTVAHHVSAIAVQAQAGRAVAASDPERALGVLPVIEEAASRTLAEMRAIVGSLREGADAQLAPRQGVGDLVRLAELVPDGLTVDVEVDEHVRPLGSAVDAAVYRIARESVTNTVRHARRATRIRIVVEPDGELVRLTVEDDGQPVETARGDGYGLVGMAERAHLLGGRCSAGPSPRGRGWLVEAAFPHQEAVS